MLWKASYLVEDDFSNSLSLTKILPWHVNIYFITLYFIEMGIWIDIKGDMEICFTATAQPVARLIFDNHLSNSNPEARVLTKYAQHLCGWWICTKLSSWYIINTCRAHSNYLKNLLLKKSKQAVGLYRFINASNRFGKITLADIPTNYKGILDQLHPILSFTSLFFYYLHLSLSFVKLQICCHTQG